jgi:hypothetical protein
LEPESEADPLAAVGSADGVTLCVVPDPTVRLNIGEAIVSSATAIDTTRLEELRKRFKTASDARPDLNAVVICRPESRTADMRELAACLDTPNQFKSTVVKELLDFIPPRTGRFSEIFPPKNLNSHHAGIVHKVFERAKTPKRGPKSSKFILYRETWYIAVVGDTSHRDDMREYLKLSAMTKEAASLLPEEAEGDTPLTKWIINLANRGTPLDDQSGRLVLRIVSLASTEGNGTFSSPVWVPFVAGDDSQDWWAAWLPNVYHLSAVAIEKITTPVAPPEPVSTALSIVLSHGGRNYSTEGGDPILVTEEEDSVLQAFLAEGMAMDEPTLEKRSGSTNIARVMKHLSERYRRHFSTCIRTPGAKNGGGYFIRVKKM